MSIDLAAIPSAPADPGELRRCAEVLRQTGVPLRLSAEDVLLAWGLLPAAYRAPEAADLHGTMIGIGPAADEVATGVGLACRAVETLADELETVNRERDALAARVEGRVIPGLPELPVSDDPFAQRLAAEARADAEAAFRRDCTGLIDRWAAAVDACAAALRAIPDVPWSLSHRLGIDEPALTLETTSITDAAAAHLLGRLTDRAGVDAARLLAVHPEWGAILRSAQPAVISRWWKSLPAPTASALMTAIPTVIGNLDGVDIPARTTANRSRAAARIEALRRRRLDAEASADGFGSSAEAPREEATRRLRELDLEIAYFEAVHDGRKQLYAWDPDHGSLIEMSGDPSRATSALLVLPGTNTRAESFFGEEPITRFADWQTSTAHGSVVSFTVLTGPMPQLNEVLVGGGPQLNEYARERAPEYASFVRGISAVEPDLWTMSYEHSYAGAVGSAAEPYGGTVDSRFMAATVGAIGPYTPDPQTQYFAAQGPDDINRYYAGLRLGELGFDVAPESFPGVHIVDTSLPGVDPMNLVVGGAVGIVSDSVEHHNALMSDDETMNGRILYSVNSLLLTQGIEQ